MQLVTKSGSRYDIRTTAAGKEVRRVPGTDTNSAKVDYLWKKFIFQAPVAIGQPVTFIMEAQTTDVEVSLLKTSPLTAVIW